MPQRREPPAGCLAISGPIGRAEVGTLCERVRSVVRATDATTIDCDVGELAGADLGTVDALARVALTARRLGCRIVLRGAAPELSSLLTLAGLTEVVPCLPASSEPWR